MTDDRHPLWRLVLASSRLVVLNMVSMLALSANRLARTARGGR
jgi:hypothetical protein